MASSSALFDLSHGEARAALATGAPVYLPVNPVEYHGPHLSLHNDALVSAGLIRDLHARLTARHPAWPLLVARDLEIGVDPAPGPGTRSTPFGVARDLVREACRALAELGAQRVVLVTFHGAPLHSIALDAGVALLAARGVRALAPFTALLRELLTLDGAQAPEAFAGIDDPAERAAMVRDLGTDFHAGFFETSVALHYAPGSVAPAYRTLPPCPPVTARPAVLAAARAAGALGLAGLDRELRLVAHALGWYALRPFPGYTGRPHRASAAAGAVFARGMVDRFAAVTEHVFAGGRAPAPIMPWLPAVSLGGRVGTVHASAADVAAV